MMNVAFTKLIRDEDVDADEQGQCFSSLTEETSSMFHNPFSTCHVKPGAIPFFFEKDFLLSLRAQNAARFDKYFYETFTCGDSNTGSWVALQFLADSFADLRYCAQITGPHGAGKSTLLAGLEKVLKGRGNKIFTFALHDNQKNFPPEFWIGVEKLLQPERSLNNESSSFPSGRKESSKILISKSCSTSSQQERTENDSIGPNQFIFLDGYEQLSFRNRLRFLFLCRRNRLGALITAHKPILGYPILLQVKPSLEQLRQVVGYLTEDQDILFDSVECSELFDLYKGNIRDILFALYDEFEERRTLLDFHKKITAQKELPPH